MSLPRPAGHTLPPSSWIDRLTTIATAGTDILPFLIRLALVPDLPSTGSDIGLAQIRAGFSVTLRRLGVDLEVLRADRVPRAGGLILMWNQESHLDHLILPVAIPRPFVSLYNNALKRVPFYGAHMERGGHIHVDRNNEAQWRASVARAAARAKEGEAILVSPEGTRSWDGKLLPMKRGAFILAESAAQPIVCVTVIGGHERMPRGSPFVRRGPVRVVFSEAIAPSSVKRMEEEVAETFRGIKARHGFG